MPRSDIATRIMEIILGLFIVAFIIRAIPNVDVIPNTSLGGRSNQRRFGKHR